jgi:hypothetical protein
MLATLLAATFLTASPADDFFPLVPGTRRTYEEVSGGAKATSVDEVGASVDVAGKPAIPITTKVGDQVVGMGYYRSEPEGIFLIGNDPKQPLPKPMPLLIFNGSMGNWEYSGHTSAAKNAAEFVNVAGEARVKGERNVLGRKVPVIEVHLVTMVDAGLARVTIDQTSIYAKGIGLVETVTKQGRGKKQSTQVLRLVKVEEAKATG